MINLVLTAVLTITAASPTSVWAQRIGSKQNEQATSDSSISTQKKRKKKRKPPVADVFNALEAGKTSSGRKATKKPTAISAVSDAELASIYTFIASGKSLAALNQIEALLVKAPNHKLLHLLRADVLVILSQGTRAGSRHAAQDTLGKLSAFQQEHMHILQQEAWLRLNSHANRAKAKSNSLVPRQLLKLADNEPYALVVDSKLSRLYVYQNIPNSTPKLINDFYVTQGKRGVFKLQEGDQRTPIGVYFNLGLIQKALPDLYGVGALNMDYPNVWDKSKGRTGHGIWLHGVPSDTYVRAPYASDGCLALSNPDMTQLFALTNNGSMPIVVTDKLDWVEASSQEATRKQIQLALSAWLKFDKVNARDSTNVVNLALIEYPSEAGMLLSRFDLIDAKQRVIKKELYWKKESGQWKVLIDNTL